MNDQELRQTLRRLPRQEASKELTPRLLARLEAQKRRLMVFGLYLPANLPRWAAAGFVLVAVLGLVLGRDRESSSPDEPARVSANAPPAPLERLPGDDLAGLRREHRQLLLEVRELQRLVEGGEPVLYLGGNDRFDVFYPLEESPPDSLDHFQEPSNRQPLRIVPAGWKSY